MSCDDTKVMTNKGPADYKITTCTEFLVIILDECYLYQHISQCIVYFSAEIN